jgi:hypothetical protein
MDYWKIAMIVFLYFALKLHLNETRKEKKLLIYISDSIFNKLTKISKTKFNWNNEQNILPLRNYKLSRY